MKLIIYTDGASRGNPGPASYGFVIFDRKGKLIHQAGEFIGKATNNVAEYTAVLEAFKYLKKEFLEKLSIEFLADSRLVVEQLSGRFKIKNQNLKILFEQIKILEMEIGEVFYRHIPREKNFRADSLANEALDKIY